MRGEGGVGAAVEEERRGGARWLAVVRGIILVAGWVSWFTALGLPVGKIPLVFFFLFGCLTTQEWLTGGRAGIPVGALVMPAQLLCAVLTMVGMMVGRGAWLLAGRIAALGLVLGAFCLMYDVYYESVAAASNEVAAPASDLWAELGSGIPVLAIGSVTICIGMWIVSGREGE